MSSCLSPADDYVEDHLDLNLRQQLTCCEECRLSKVGQKEAVELTGINVRFSARADSGDFLKRLPVQSAVMNANYLEPSLSNAKLTPIVYFNGRILYCIAHGWVFDGHNGKCLQPAGWAMKEYPMRIENGMVQVDVAAD